MEIGFGGFGFKGGGNGGGNWNFVELITVSHRQADIIGKNKLWSVGNKEEIKDKNGNITGYSGDVFTKNIFRKEKNTGVKVQSGITTDKNGDIKSNNNWISKDYKIQQE